MPPRESTGMANSVRPKRRVGKAREACDVIAVQSYGYRGRIRRGRAGEGNPSGRSS